MCRLLFLTVGAASTLALAQSAPRLEVEPTKWNDGSIDVSVSVRAPASGERVAIGGAGKAWQSAISLTVSNEDGVAQRWPFDSPGSPSASAQVVLSSNIGERVSVLRSWVH